MRWVGALSHGKAGVIWRAIHSAVGWSVTLSEIRRRRSWRRMTKTNSSRKLIVGTGASRRSECSGPCGGLVANGMKKGCYHAYRFPPEVIHQAIWLYLRFTLSLRDVEDLLAQRGIGLSYESIRRWVNHFGPLVAADLRKRRPRPHSIWHLDEVYLKIDGRLVYLWRAVDAEGEVLDVLVQAKRNKHAALKLFSGGVSVPPCRCQVGVRLAVFCVVMAGILDYLCRPRPN